MKIVHVAEPFASGIAVFVKSLVEHLPNDYHIIIHGERKEVMSAAEVKKIFPLNNVRFIRWKYAHRKINPFKDTAALLHLTKLLSRLKDADAVHLHSSKSGFLGRIACRLAGITNIIYTPNGAPFLSGNPFSNFVFRQLELVGAALGGKVICCSQSEQYAYKKIGIKAGYINNGTQLGSISSIIAPVEERFIIANSGRIEKQKNAELFNTIAEYFKDFPQFLFLWIGDGTKRDVLKSPNIHLTGWVSEEEALQWVDRADVFLSTSHYEGLSFSIMEAMSLNKPLLLTDCVGNRDMVQHRMNGDLFKTADEAILKILEYYNNADMLNIMGSHSKEVCTKEFNVERNFSNYRRIYRKFVIV